MKPRKETHTVREGRVKLKDLLNRGLETSGLEEEMGELEARTKLPEKTEEHHNNTGYEEVASDVMELPASLPISEVKKWYEPYDLKQAINATEAAMLPQPDKEEKTSLQVYGPILQSEGDSEEEDRLFTAYTTHSGISEVDEVTPWQAASLGKVSETVFAFPPAVTVTEEEEGASFTRIIEELDAKIEEVAQQVRQESDVTPSEEATSSAEIAQESPVVPQEVPTVLEEGTSAAEAAEEEEEDAPQSIFAIEGTIKVSGDTGKIILEKLDEQTAQETAKRREVFEAQQRRIQQEAELFRNTGFRRPQDVLKEWVRFAQVQQGASDVMQTQLANVLARLEREGGAHKEVFATLASSAEKQEAKAQTYADQMEWLTIEGEKIPLASCLNLMEDAFADMVDKMVFARKKTMAMHYALESACSQVKAAETLVARLNNVSRNIHQLAIKASIEAAYIGEAANGFSAVMEEVRNFSKDIGHVASEMHAQLEKAVTEVVASDASLQDLKTIEMTDHIILKGKMDTILSAITEQQTGVADLIQDIAGTSKQVSSDVRSVVEEIRQSDAIAETVAGVAQGLEALKGHTQHYTASALKSLGVELPEAVEVQEVVSAVRDSCADTPFKQEFMKHFQCETVPEVSEEEAFVTQ